MERAFDVGLDSDLDCLLSVDDQVAIDELHFWIRVEDVRHPDVQGLREMLQQITVNFYDGKHRIPANPEYIESLIRGIDAQASLHMKLCLCWTHVIEKVDDKTQLRVTAEPYEFATPIGYTTQ